jgi:hypothetical protein
MTVNADDRLVELGLVLPEIPATPFTPRLRPVAVQGDIAYRDLPLGYARGGRGSRRRPRRLIG